jgi:nucleoside-diphosphate-sugar epimerase
MKIFVAGASGAVGKSLIPVLVKGKHQVFGTARSTQSLAAIRAMGAVPLAMDGLDARAVLAAVRAANPDVIVHQMTALAGIKNLKHFDEAFALTNRLRTEGVAHLIAAAREVGTPRIIVQSYTGWPHAPGGDALKTEEDPLDPTPIPSMRASLAAIRELERSVLAASDLQGIVLRYGSFYGPGTPIAPGGEIAELVRRRRLPIVGSGAGVWSFVHMEDVALATALAAEGGANGIYHIVDDEPAPTSVWLPELARILGAKPPRHVPEWVARLMVGEALVHMMTRVPGAANTKAKRELGWNLRYPTWRQGFRHDFALRATTRALPS